MEQRRNGKKDNDADTDRGLFARIVEGIIVFCICVIALRYAIEILISIQVPLIIIAVIAVAITIAWRIYKYKRRHDDY